VFRTVFFVTVTKDDAVSNPYLFSALQMYLPLSSSILALLITREPSSFREIRSFNVQTPSTNSILDEFYNIEVKTKEH
jgi:hypothetical protein